MKKRSFTLIEALILILLVSIISVVIINSKSNLFELRYKNAAYKIRSDIRYAQSLAISTQVRTRVAFNPGLEEYRIYTELTPNNWGLAVNHLTRADFIVSFMQGEFQGVDIVSRNFDGLNYDLVFDASGTPYSYNLASFSATKLVSQGVVNLSGSASVTVEVNTGKVSINV